jgi:hypothetical protein
MSPPRDAYARYRVEIDDPLDLYAHHLAVSNIDRRDGERFGQGLRELHHDGARPVEPKFVRGFSATKGAQIEWYRHDGANRDGYTAHRVRISGSDLRVARCVEQAEFPIRPIEVEIDCASARRDAVRCHVQSLARPPARDVKEACVSSAARSRPREGRWAPTRGAGDRCERPQQNRLSSAVLLARRPMPRAWRRDVEHEVRRMRPCPWSARSGS